MPPPALPHVLPHVPPAVLTTKEYMRIVSEIKPEWVLRCALPACGGGLQRLRLRLRLWLLPRLGLLVLAAAAVHVTAGYTAGVGAILRVQQLNRPEPCPSQLSTPPLRPCLDC